jgi:phospholipid-binding lipoprotein MlaA
MRIAWREAGMKDCPIVRSVLLVFVVAAASGCAALSDGLSEAPGGPALPGVLPSLELAGSPVDAGSIVLSQPEPESAPAAVDESAAPPLVAAAEPPAKEAPDEFYDPFAKKDDVVAGEESDPWEGFNDVMFEFNRKFDKYLLKPVAKVYDKVVPDALEKGFSNFFHNARVGPRLINNVLQLKIKGAGIELARLLINSTLGLAGFFDPAKNWFDLTTPDEDTGQTLGAYGVPPGPYLVLPLLPPLTVRDFFGLLLDFGADPINYFVFPTFEVDDWPSAIAHKNRDTTTIAQFGTRVEEIVNDRSLNMEKFQGVEEATVDLYAAVRNAYLQKRAKAIRE